MPINQRGFSPVVIIIAVLVILGVGFFAGTNLQKQSGSNTVELLQSPSPSIEASPITSTKAPKATSVPSVNPTSVPKTPASSAPASAASSTPTPAPTQTPTNTSDSNAPTFIKVASPNGGESFKVGDNMHVTWSSNNLYKSGSCIITLAYDNGSKSTAWAPVNTPNGYFDWKLASEAGGKQAKVDMQCYDSGSNGYSDQSDNYFTIAN